MKRALAIVALGYFVHWWRGRAMLDPFFLIPFGALSSILASHAIQSGLSFRRTILQSCGTIAAVISAALIAANWRFPPAEWLLPDPVIAVDALTFTFSAAGLAAVLTTYLISRFPAPRIRLAIRLAMALILIGLVELPGRWLGAAIAAVLDWGFTPTTLALSAAMSTAAYAVHRTVKSETELKSAHSRPISRETKKA